MKNPTLMLPTLFVASCAMPERGAVNEIAPAPRPAWQSAHDADSVDGDWWRHLDPPQLTKAIERTLTHNHDLRAAQARVLAAVAQATLAGVPGAPKLDATFDAMRQRIVFVGFPFGGGGPIANRFDTFGVGLNASWEPDLWGRLGAAEGAARAELEASAADLRAAQLSLAGQTAKAFYATVEAREQIALSRRTVASYRATEQQTEDRFGQGIKSALDLRLARSRRMTAEAQVEQWQRAFEQAARQLQALQGRYPDASADLPTALPKAVDAEIAAGLPAHLIARRPDLVAATHRLHAAGFRVDEAQARLYPRLSFSAGIGTNADRVKDLLDLDFLVWNLATNLVKPILDGGQGRADRALAIAREHEAIANFARLSLRAFTEVETLLASARLVRRQLARLEAAATEATSAQSLAEERYRTGIGEYLAVLESQRGALTLQSQRITTHRLLLELRVDLHVALGGGFELATAASEPGDPR